MRGLAARGLVARIGRVLQNWGVARTRPPGTRWGHLAACLVVAVLATGPASAQTAPDTLVVDLEAALEMARHANPAFERAANALEVNTAERRATWMGQVLPNVTANLLNTGYSGNLSYRAVDNFGNPIANPNAEWSYFSSTRQALTLDWNIQGKSFLNAARAQSLDETARAVALESAAWTLVGQVRTDYHDALEQLALLEIEQSLLAGREFDLESARRRFGIAQASRVDVLNAEVQLEQQMIAVRQARSGYEQALLTLRTTIGDADAPPLRIAPTELPIFDPETVAVDALVSRAMRMSPQLREAEVAVDQARIGVARAGESWWPNLNLRYNLGRLSQAQEIGAFTDLTHQENDLQSSFSLSLSLPVLNSWFQDRAQEVQAEVALANQRATLRERELEVERAVRAQYLTLENQWESLGLARRSAEIAEEASRLAREEYRLGTRTFEQLQQTLQQEADARRSVIQAEYGFVDALLQLETAVGGPVGPDGTD